MFVLLLENNALCWVLDALWPRSHLAGKATLFVGVLVQSNDRSGMFAAAPQETLDEWLACQRTWMYLESIFGSPDIVRQLPAAAKMFQAVDKSWRHIMVLTADEPLAIKQVTALVY